MKLLPFRGLGIKGILLLVAALVAVPADAFACWYECQSLVYMYGDWWELDHCVQSWPDNQSYPSTTCYYRRVVEPE